MSPTFADGLQKRGEGYVSRKIAKILGISPTYLSLLLNGKRPWRGNLKERYEELVNIFVNTTAGSGEKEEETNLAFVSEKKVGGAAGTRTPYLFNAIEALSQMSYSPTRFGKQIIAGFSYETLLLKTVEVRNLGTL